MLLKHDDIRGQWVRYDKGEINMPGIGGFFKGVKASFAQTAKGAPKGTYTKTVNGQAVATKAKPGYKMNGGKVTKEQGLLAAAKRNPKNTLALGGAAALGGAYLYSQYGAPSTTSSTHGQQTSSYY